MQIKTSEENVNIRRKLRRKNTEGQGEQEKWNIGCGEK